LPKVELFEADTSEAGLAMARRQLPDVIFLDINLPGEDGYRILDRLHNEPALRAIPVIGLSAHSLPSERARAMAAGFTDYLGKPARLQDVLAAITRLKTDAA